MKVFKGFASDNNAAVHPAILEAMRTVNMGHAIAYGDDPYTEEAVATLKSHFGDNIEAYFVFTGTGANVLALNAATETFHSVISAETAHIQVDECGAPEKFIGCKLLSVPSQDGKIQVRDIKKHLHGFGFEHHSQPKVISISQTTELGTLYTPDEIKEIADLAHSYNMYLHVDGARIANAATALGLEMKDFTSEVGVDILSLGGTKNGMMYGEAVIFFEPELAANFKYYRKQSMQLASKMRYIAAQFSALYGTDLWKENAQHANKMALLMEKKLQTVQGVRITQKVEANGVFAIVPEHVIEKLQKDFFFYTWDESTNEVRWMTSWDTTEEEVLGFVEKLKFYLLD